MRRVLQIRSQCSKNSAEAPDTVNRYKYYNGRLRAQRASVQIRRYPGMAHLAVGCCECESRKLDDEDAGGPCPRMYPGTRVPGYPDSTRVPPPVRVTRNPTGEKIYPVYDSQLPRVLESVACLSFELGTGANG
eukprot:3191212-Rhodomonas_salina.1